jgi:hypothetical protein
MAHSFTNLIFHIFYGSRECRRRTRIVFSGDAVARCAGSLRLRCCVHRARGLALCFMLPPAARAREVGALRTQGSFDCPELCAIARCAAASQQLTNRTLP